MPNKKKKIAIVYDWIDKWGGVERVLLYLHRLFPEADFFTSAIDVEGAPWAKDITIKTSFLQAVPAPFRRNRALMLPLYPLAFEAFSFNDYDAVISITSAFAKGIVTKPDTRHICYLLTPPRYLWNQMDEYLSPFARFLATPAIAGLRNWDRAAATRPDEIIAISDTVAKRAKNVYGTESAVIYPPFDCDYWDTVMKDTSNSSPEVPRKPFYLWVGRMEGYKRAALIVEAACKMPEAEFVFVGTGSLMDTLKKQAPPNCRFMGLIPDKHLSLLYRNAKALLMPQNEDFGYVSLEAQYHGCPVVAFGQGGALETVKEGKTGVFFADQTASSLLRVLERFDQISYNLKRFTVNEKNAIRNTYGLERFTSQFLYHLQ